MNISTELERSFGDGPPLRPVEVPLAAGRSALRRRRAVTGLAGIAAGAVLASGWLVLSPGETTGSGLPATDPTPTKTSAPDGPAH